MENGYHLYSFSGALLREDAIENFKQFAWRPRPDRLLSKDEMKNVRKNLREYSKSFEESDNAKKSSADKAVVEGRRRLLEEWMAWRGKVDRELREEREEEGLGMVSEEREVLLVRGEEGEVVDELHEEILEETEEVME